MCGVVDMKCLFVFIMVPLTIHFQKKYLPQDQLLLADLLASIYASVSNRSTCIQRNLSSFNIEDTNSSFLEVIHLFM